MRTRKNRVSLYLDDKEMEKLKRNVKSTGLTYNSYLRMLISGYGPTESPDDKFWDVMEEIRQFADKIDEVGLKADSSVDILAIMAEAKKWRIFQAELESEFIRPKKIDTLQLLTDAADDSR